jgi:hypothetical protein
MDADLGDDLRGWSGMDDPGARCCGARVAIGIANPAELPISTSIVRLHYDGSDRPLPDGRGGPGRTPC